MIYQPSKWVLEELLRHIIIGRNSGKTTYSPYNLILKDLKERFY